MAGTLGGLDPGLRDVVAAGDREPERREPTDQLADRSSLPVRLPGLPRRLAREDRRHQRRDLDVAASPPGHRRSTRDVACSSGLTWASEAGCPVIVIFVAGETLIVTMLPSRSRSVSELGAHGGDAAPIVGQRVRLTLDHDVDLGVRPPGRQACPQPEGRCRGRQHQGREENCHGRTGPCAQLNDRPTLSDPASVQRKEDVKRRRQGETIGSAANSHIRSTEGNPDQPLATDTERKADATFA